MTVCLLARRIFDDGRTLVWDRAFYIDALNVFVVTLTAFVGLTTSIFSRPYMRVEFKRERVASAAVPARIPRTDE